MTTGQTYRRSIQTVTRETRCPLSILLFVGLIGAINCWPVARCTGQEDPPAKKVIEWGWDEPDTKFIREHIAEMQQLPFDGLVFHVNSNKGGNLTWEMWGERKFEPDEFQHAIDDLKSTTFDRFTDNFLRVNVSPGKVDWFDDTAWSTVVHNYAIASQIAKEGGCRGFMFDVEQYNEGLYDYAQQPHRDSKTFGDYQTQVRERGRQWMQTVNQSFADITVLMTFGYRIAQPGQGSDRSTAHYGLLADFLDGMLDACSPETKIVDAWEFAYPYKTPKQFQEGYETIRTKSLEWTQNTQQYRRHVTAGFGLWMDCHWRQVGWNLEDFSKNHFTPGEFENSVRLALKTSDQYVWIYTEQPRWWTNEKLPPEYVAALTNARQAAPSPFKPEVIPCEGIYPQHLQGICTNGQDAALLEFHQRVGED